jgi:NitT/TauT family transport system substrate-binding protein
MSVRPARMTGWCAVLCAVAALAGCGGGGGGGGGGSSAGSGGDSGRTAVDVQDVAGIPSDYLTAGVKKGFFRKHGLDVTVKTAAGGAAIIPAVVSGDVEFGGSNVVSVLLGATKGLPIKLVAPGTFGPTSEKADWSAILVKGDSGIRTPRDLEGRTIAVNTLNNVATETARAALENLGVDATTVKYTEIDFPDMLAALDQGRVDAAFEIEPFVTAGLSQGDRRIVSPYYATKPGLQIGTYVASEKYVQENPDVVKAFQAGLADTARFVSSQPDAFRKVLASEGIKGAQKILLPTWKPEVDIASLNTHASLMKKFDMISEQPPIRDLVSTDAGS